MTTDVSPLREAAIHVENVYAQRIAERLGPSVGRVVSFVLPETFGRHRAEFTDKVSLESETPSSADCLAVSALSKSFDTVQRLGTKQMPGDPVPMTRLVGEVYDKYKAAMYDPAESKARHITVIDDNSLELLQDMATQFQADVGMVMAIASEHYAQQLKKQL